VILSDDKVVESEERSKDVIVDYNKSGEDSSNRSFKSKRQYIDLPIVLKSA